MPLADFMIDHFEDIDQEILAQVRDLENRRNLSLVKKIEGRKNNDTIRFYSWLSEMRYGLFFDKISSELKYDKPLKVATKPEPQTPDWTMTINSQKIFADVLRLSRMTREDLEIYIEELHDIRRRNKEAGFTRYIMGSSPQVMSSQYYYGCQTAVTDKEEKYRDAIIEHKLPFIICPAVILESFLDGLDTFDFLIANNKKGIFYTNDDFGRNVTGVLFRSYWGEFIYYHNERAENKLNDENYNLFQSFAYRPKEMAW